MRTLVTGRAGFIGANLCGRLAASDAITEVGAIDDLSTGFAESLVGVDAELVEGTILDVAFLDRVTRGMGAVVHVGARPSVPRSLRDPIGLSRGQCDRHDERAKKRRDVPARCT
jgi:UDP-glucose 4-epimerase